MIEEIWKPIRGYDDTHQISNFGRVKNFKNNRIVSQFKRTGYFRVNLWNYDLQKQNKFSVHRLVAEHFLEEPSDELKNIAQTTKMKIVLVNHIDGDKTNNRVDNLEWCNQVMNLQHAVDTGLRTNGIGETNYASKLTEHDVLEIRKLYKEQIGGRWTHKKLSEKFNVSSANISDVINRKTWKHI